MKRCSSAPCLENVGNDVKRVKGIERDADASTKEYLELALTRVLELQREIKEDTYAETDNGSSDLDASGSEEDLSKEILVKVFQDLPEASTSIAKIMDSEKRWRNARHMNAIHSKKIQLLGFDTCRRIALEFMKNIVRESRNKSAKLDIGEPEYLDLPFQQNGRLLLADGILASDLYKGEMNAQETRMRMLKSLDLHLATKQRDYTAKLMNSAI